ncbi:MAG: hydroxymethylglutaryl-CoA lyase [Legionellales bacterium]|nr:hydroxymethylglutaryl-CoA lyase [Legionellales bacterium]|tara:strand:+ start:299 stop:1186 length:888 start_codon:yes stop_codon:yes gene_type:complete
MAEISIVEVGPRDGLQNESISLSVDQKYTFIKQLLASGLSCVELGSFVSPRAVPAMSNTSELAIKCQDLSADLLALVPNQKGLEAALDAKIKHVAVFAAASQTFSKKNIGQSIGESLDTYRTLIRHAKENQQRVRGYVSCVAGCPYEGEISVSEVVKVAKALYEMGCEQISLGDTVGYSTPVIIKGLLKAVADVIPLSACALHIHDTYGQALASVAAGIEAGIQTIDTAVAGLGGCPYAPGAAGNLATEDLLYFCAGQGLETGVDLEKLLQVTRWLEAQGFSIRSKAARAMISKG